MCTLVACVEYVYTAPDCQLAIIVTITHLIHSLWGQRTETVKNALTLLPPPACTPTPSPPPAPVKRRWGDGRGGGGAAHQPGPRVTGGLNLKGWPQCAVLASPPHNTPPTPPLFLGGRSPRKFSCSVLALQLLSLLSLITVQTHEGSSWCHQLIYPSLSSHSSLTTKATLE